MTEEEITDFEFLSPIVAYVDFVQNKQYFRQIAQRLREHSIVSRPWHNNVSLREWLEEDHEKN